MKKGRLVWPASKKERYDFVKKKWADLSSRHGLQGWGFGLDNHPVRWGITKFSPKKVLISKHLVQSAETTKDEVNDTIVHQIAHVIAGVEAGHGERWKEVARRLGGTAEVYAPRPALSQTVEGDGLEYSVGPFTKKVSGREKFLKSFEIIQRQQSKMLHAIADILTEKK